MVIGTMAVFSPVQRTILACAVSETSLSTGPGSISYNSPSLANATNWDVLTYRPSDTLVFALLIHFAGHIDHEVREDW